MRARVVIGAVACAVLFLAVVACTPHEKAPPSAAGDTAPDVEATPQRIADRIAAGLADPIDAKLRKDIHPSLMAVLVAPQAMEIFALHPYPEDVDDEMPELAELPVFDDYPVLGQAAITSAEDQRALIDLICEGIYGGSDMAEECFFPRHGVRIKGADRTVDLIICYECLQIAGRGLPEGVDVPNTSDSVAPRVTAFYEAHGLKIHEDD